jgi:rhomboid protease GluP
MLQQSKSFTVSNADESTLQALVLGTLSRLGWKVSYAGDKIIVAHTPRKWNKWDDEIVVEIVGSQLRVTSKLTHGEFWDLFGKNKKHLRDFSIAFDATRASAVQEHIDEWKDHVKQLQQTSISEAEQQQREIEEAARVMDPYSGNMYFTYAIIAINVVIYMAMVMARVHFFSPDAADIVKWGGNLSLLTFGGDWWRLITSMFIHVGILHLVLNMYALLVIGSYLEPMLGKARFIIAYFATGLVASLVSVLWHKNDMTVSAGASGAIFGLFGVFLALLTTNVVPPKTRTPLLQSVLIFVGYNVLYGFREGSAIDNSAHLGGLVSGMLVGYAYYFTFKNVSEGRKQLIAAAVTGCVLIGAYIILKQEETPRMKMDMKTGGFYEEGRKEQDNENAKFKTKLIHFDAIQAVALDAMHNRDSLVPEEYLKQLRRTTLKNWAECIDLMDEAAKLKLSEPMEQLRKDIVTYSEYRIEQTKLMISRLEENTNKYDSQLDSIGKVIQGMTDKIEIK